jgi:cell division septation protein DedD
MALRSEMQGDAPRLPRRAMTIVAVLAVMLLSAGGLWAAWRILAHRGPASVPVIHADERPVKVPPANPGGMAVPDQNIYVLNGERPSDSKIEQLLPSPESPLPRPVAEPESAPVSVSPPPQVNEVAVQPAAPPPAAAVAIVPSPAPPAPAPVAAPAPAVAAAPPAPAVARAQPPAGAGFLLQVGAVRSEDEAKAEAGRLKRAQGDVLGALDFRTVKAELGARGVFYRIEAGPLADKAARTACDTLKERKVGCILVRP